MPQAQSVAIPKRWPLVAQPDNRDQTTLFDSKIVNAIVEKSVDGYEVEKRPGLGGVAYALAAGGQGMFRWPVTVTTPFLIMVSGNNVYVVQYFEGTPTFVDKGTILPGGTCHFTPVPGVVPYVIFGSGVAGYYFLGPTSAIFQITDPNYPPVTVPGFVYLDGTTYVMDPSGTIWGSAGLDDPTTWDPLNQIQANADSDPAVCLAKQLVYVVALKLWSVQFFYDAGNATGSPLAAVPGALLNIGCISADTVQVIDDLMFWVTYSRNDAPRVVMMRNLQPTIISTPAVERTIQGGTPNTGYYSWTQRIQGHRLYFFCSLADNISWVFDIDESLWYQWTSPTGGVYPIVAQANDLSGSPLAQHYNNGDVYYTAPDYVYPNDAGVEFPVDIYTPNEDFKVDRRKMLSTMRFNADQTDGSVLYVRASEDDYQTWSNFRKVDLSKKRPILTGLGTFYRRAYHFRHYCNTKFRIRSVDLQMDIGTL